MENQLYAIFLYRIGNPALVIFSTPRHDYEIFEKEKYSFKHYKKKQDRHGISFSYVKSYENSIDIIKLDNQMYM